MGYAVELGFDPASEARVRALWQKLADQGLSSVLLELGARPHISLAVAESLDAAAFEPVLAEFARASAPLELALSAVGHFPTDEGVVYLAPTVTPELLELHRALYARLEALGLETNTYYRPGRWVPHCTAATDLARADVPRAVALCAASDAYGPIALESVALVEWRPVTELCAFRLGGRYRRPARGGP